MAADTATTTTAPARQTSQQSAEDRLKAANALPPAGSPQPAPAPEATPDTNSSGFIEKTDAEIAAMPKEDQDQYYVAANAAQNAADAAKSGTPAPPVTPMPTSEQIHGGKLTQAQIAALPFQQQQQYLQRQRAASKDDTFGPSTYVAPPPAKASDYVSDEHFVAQITDPVTGEKHAATSADVVGPTDWKVTDEQTVQGQMTKLTTDLQNNPVYQSLAETMKRVNAAAGGGNSLMAQSAAYDKVIGLAFNIATSDAATYAKSAEFNATMANQFGLAKNNFIYQALLSDQNYSQSQVLQSNQIKGNLDSVDRQISGQLESTKIAGKAQIKSASIQAGGMVHAANISADASMKNAALSAKTSLTEANMQRQTTLDLADITHQSRMAEQAQAAGFDVGKALVQGDIQKDVNKAAGDEAFARQVVLNDQIDTSNRLGGLEARIAHLDDIAGITPEERARAIESYAKETSTDINLVTTKTNAILDSIRNGPTKTSQYTADNPYGPYGDYFKYDTTPLPFYKGHQAGTPYPPEANTDIGNSFLPGMPVG